VQSICRNDSSESPFRAVFRHFTTLVPGSSYWNIGIGREIGDVEKDEEGVATMRILGRNMAWLMKRLDGEG